MTFSTIQGFDEISTLSKETFDKIFQKPDSSATLINRVATQVIENLQLTKDTASINKFLHSLIILDKEYQNRNDHRKSPIQGSIQKLQSILSELKPVQKPASVSSTSSQREKLETQFKNILQSLDLESPNFSARITEAKDILKKLQDINALSAPQFQQLTAALESIQTKGYYKEQLFERRAWKAIGRLSTSFQKALEGAEPLLKNIEQKQGPGLMLKHLKNNRLSLVELADSIPSQWEKIQKDLIQLRLDAIISKMPNNNSFSTQTFSQNFFLLKEALENFSLNIAYPAFSKEWEKIQNLLNKEAKGFSKALKTYPYMDVEVGLPAISAKAEIYYTSPLKIEDFFTLDSKQFKQKIADLDRIAHDKFPDFFKQHYKKLYDNKHRWLAFNLSFFKQHYNQAEDINRNQGEGTCFQNSLERHRLLLQSPSIEGKQIPMGSSNKGRIVCASVNQSFKAADKGLISHSQAKTIENDSSKKLGLERTLQIPFSPSPDTVKSVLQYIDKTLSTSQSFTAILSLYGPGGGHAINIQIDPKAKIFRLIDDNIGVVEWPSYQEFQTQFSAYLEAFYPEYKIFNFKFYRLI